MSITSVLRSCFSCCYPQTSVVPSTELHDDPQPSSSVPAAEMRNPASLHPAAPPPSPNRSSAATSCTFTGPVFYTEPQTAEPATESAVLMVIDPQGDDDDVIEDGFVRISCEKKIN